MASGQQKKRSGEEGGAERQVKKVRTSSSPAEEKKDVVSKNEVSGGKAVVSQKEVGGKTEVAEALEIFDSAFEAARGITKKLGELGEKCLKEQLKVEMDYRRQKAPLLAERDASYEKARDSFWGEVLCRHGWVKQFIREAERELLTKHLASIRVDDALDENGSYSIKLIFKKSAEPIFKPLVLERQVTIKNDEKEEDADHEVTVKTNVIFADKAADPRQTAAAGKEEKGQWFSIFDWANDAGDLSPLVLDEVLRNDVYAEPERVFLDTSEDDEDSDDEEEEDDSEENDSGDEEEEEEDDN